MKQKQKKQYENLVIEMLDCHLEGTVLDASLTTVQIDVNEVTVDDFDNGFDSEPGGFQGISFD